MAEHLDIAGPGQRPAHCPAQTLPLRQPAAGGRAARLDQDALITLQPDDLLGQVRASGQVRPPLSAAERLEHLAIGVVLARYYWHPSMLHHAAGASWEQIGAARGTSAGQARQDYRQWAEGQHNLHAWTKGRFGMSDAGYAQAMERTGAAGACAQRREGTRFRRRRHPAGPVGARPQRRQTRTGVVDW